MVAGRARTEEVTLVEIGDASVTTQRAARGWGFTVCFWLFALVVEALGVWLTVRNPASPLLIVQIIGLVVWPLFMLRSWTCMPPEPAEPELPSPYA